jgi:hypothetical protein
VVELLTALDQQKEPLSFAAADGTAQAVAPAEVLRNFLQAQPVQIDFAERSAGADADVGAVDFAAPAGVLVNRDRLELDAKAVQYQRAHPGTPYFDAVRAVGG